MDSARRVLIAVWAARETARTSDDAPALRRLDAGVELERDLGVTYDNRRQGLWSRRVKRPLGPNLVVVPRQSRFPNSFLAAMQTSGEWALSATDHTPSGVETDLLVFTRANRASTWRVAGESRFPGPLTKLTAGREVAQLPSVGGYSPAPRQPRWITPRQAIAALAGYYQHFADYGTKPDASPFRPGTWTTGQGSLIAAVGLPGQINSRGYRNTVRYSADPHVYEFDLNGADVVCGTVRGVSIDIPPTPAGYLNQPRDRNNWGGLLAPGPYAEIHEYLMHQVCLAISPTRAGGIEAISGDDTISGWKTTGNFVPAGPSA